MRCGSAAVRVLDPDFLYVVFLGMALYSFREALNPLHTKLIVYIFYILFYIYQLWFNNENSFDIQGAFLVGDHFLYIHVL